MSAMKLTSLVILASAVNIAAVVHNARGGHSRGAKVIVLPEDKEECVEKMSEAIKKPMTKYYAIDYATDSCARDNKVEARNYVCPHFKSLLKDAFKDFNSDKKISASEFCDISEFHVLRIRQSTRVPNVGKGSHLNFTIIEDCEPTVAGAMQPEKDLPASQVADFWYSLCINQDCAHFLPSRTKWCNVDRTPTHGIEICQQMRSFAGSKVNSLFSGNLKPADVCELYDEFVDSIKAGVESYDSYIHAESREHIVTPSDHKRALTSSKLLNDAHKHHLRDNGGDAVKPWHSAAAVPRVAAAAALAAAALLAAA